MVYPGCYGSQQEGKSNEKMNPSDATKKIALRTTYVHGLVGCRLIQCSQTFSWLDASCHPDASWGATSSEGPSLTTRSKYHTPAITTCQSSLLLFSSLHSSRIFFLLLPLECNNHPIRDCPSSLDPQRLFQILAQSRSSTNICKMKTVCCTRGNPRFYSSLNFEFLAQKQIRATLKHEDHLCDLGLPCHLFPGAISQCKVQRELGASIESFKIMVIRPDCG